MPAWWRGERDCVHHHTEPRMAAWQKPDSITSKYLCRTREDGTSQGYLWPDSLPRVTHPQSRRCLKTQTVINFTENTLYIHWCTCRELSWKSLCRLVFLKFIVTPVVPKPYGVLYTEENHMIPSSWSPSPSPHLLPPMPDRFLPCALYCNSC